MAKVEKNIPSSRENSASKHKGKLAGREKPQIFEGVKVLPLPEPLIPVVVPDTEKWLTPDEYPLDYVKAQLQLAAGSVFDSENAGFISVKSAPDNTGADLAIGCQQIASKINLPAGDIAAKISEHLNSTFSFPKIVADKRGFVNVELDPKEVGTSILRTIESMGDRYGEQNIGNARTIVIDYSSPNTAKEFSIAHMRSTFRGHSLMRIFENMGYTVVGDNHLGNWGTQFGILGVAFQMWKDEYPMLKDQENAVKHPQETIKELAKIYARVSREIASQQDMLKLEGRDDEEPELKVAGRKWFEELEKGNPEARKMYDWACTLSNLEFQRMYDLTGPQFHYWLGEDYFVDMKTDIYRELKKRGLAKMSQGALVVEFDRSGGELQIVRASDKTHHDENNTEVAMVHKRGEDQTSTYWSRDFAALICRTAWYTPEKIIYVVGGEQNDHFKMLFKTFSEFAGDKAPEMAHVNFGLMKLEGRKMSTRAGNVELLETFITRSIEAAELVMTVKNQERDLDRMTVDQVRELFDEHDLVMEDFIDPTQYAKVEGRVTRSDEKLSGADIKRLSRQVGIGSVKWFDLGQPANRTIDFTWKKALSFDNGSPYIQYTHARAQSILRNAKKQNIQIDFEKEISLDSNPQINISERKLIMQLAEFPEVIRTAAKSYEPAKIADYLIRICRTYSQFYNLAPVINAENPAVRNTRLRMVEATAQVIKNGLYLMGIEAPEKM